MQEWREDSDWRNATFSLAERDRRWGLIREKMAAQGMAAIVSLTTGGAYRSAHSRYLTQIDDGDEDTAVVFPLEGEPTVWTGRGGVWPSSNWLKDIRGREGRLWGQRIAERLLELGLERATIGVASLKGADLVDGRSPEGQASYGGVMAIRERLPNASIVDATELLGECRYAKSAEEIDFLEEGTRVAEATLNALAEYAQPGTSERAVFAKMLEANVSAGGSYPFVLAWTGGPAGHMHHRIEQATLTRKVQAGDMYMPEIIGRWAGYCAQIDPTVYVREVPQEFLDAHALAAESFNRIVDAMKPGATVGEMVAAGQITALGGRLKSRVTAHGRGLGDDGPLIVDKPSEALARVEMVPGVCLVIKPSASLDGKIEAARFGDSVVVTETGARRLGTRGQDPRFAR
jgi:Xaa-Pro aminopeptidase